MSYPAHRLRMPLSLPTDGIPAPPIRQSGVSEVEPPDVRRANGHSALPLLRQGRRPFFGRNFRDLARQSVPARLIGRPLRPIVLLPHSPILRSLYEVQVADTVDPLFPALRGEGMIPGLTGIFGQDMLDSPRVGVGIAGTAR